MGIRKRRIYPELPEVTPVSTTKILVTDATTGLMGFSDVSALQVTVDGDGLATDADIAELSASIAQVFDGTGVGVFSTVQALINGTGTNFQVGDDVFIGDINVSNVMQVKGAQDGTKGYIQFGSGSAMPKIGGGGQNHLSIVNIPAYASNAAAISGGLNTNDIYRNGDNICIVH